MFISICIASYNYARYLSKGFEAIKRQNYSDYEVIYIDDASVDNSVELINNFIKNNPSMQISLIVHTENKGLLKTKTELLTLAKGKYIMLCDADDWMAPDCLELLAARAMQSNADRIITQIYDVNEKNKIIQIQDFAYKPSKWLWNIHHGCLYKREIIEKNRLKILFYPDDVYFTTLFNYYSIKIEWVSKPLYYWLVHKDSAGRSQYDCEKVIRQFEQIMIFLNKMVKKVTCKNDKKDIELLQVKIYYLQLFHELKPFSVKTKLNTYYKIKKKMGVLYPLYLENDYLKYKGYCPARNYAMCIMRLGRLLEKIHLMWFALIVYHFLCLFIEFDQ